MLTLHCINVKNLSISWLRIFAENLRLLFRNFFIYKIYLVQYINITSSIYISLKNICNILQVKPNEKKHHEKEKNGSTCFPDSKKSSVDLLYLLYRFFVFKINLCSRFEGKYYQFCYDTEQKNITDWYLYWVGKAILFNTL